jgi:hypothetical protein
LRQLRANNNVDVATAAGEIAGVNGHERLQAGNAAAVAAAMPVLLLGEVLLDVHVTEGKVRQGAWGRKGSLRHR